MRFRLRYVDYSDKKTIRPNIIGRMQMVVAKRERVDRPALLFFICEDEGGD